MVLWAVLVFVTHCYTLRTSHIVHSVVQSAKYGEHTPHTRQCTFLFTAQKIAHPWTLCLDTLYTLHSTLQCTQNTTDLRDSILHNAQHWNLHNAQCILNNTNITYSHILHCKVYSARHIRCTLHNADLPLFRFPMHNVQHTIHKSSVFSA